MTNPLDPTELLAAAKPTSQHVIEPGRLDVMIARAIATPAPVRFALLRSWQVRAGSALAAAAVATTAIVISLTGAPQGLSVLALANHTTIAGSASSGPRAANPVTFEGTVAKPAPATHATFVAGKRLATSTRALPVYAFSAVTDPTRAIISVASVLGVHEPVVTWNAVTASSCPQKSAGVSAVGATAQVTGAPFAAISCTSASRGPLTWTYNVKNSTCPQPSSLNVPTTSSCLQGATFQEHGASHQQLLEWSSSFLKGLLAHHLVPRGLNLAQPTYVANANIIYYPLVAANGVTTDEYEEFQFSDQGTLVYATGLLATTSLVNRYPVVSARAGANLLATAATGALTSINPGGPMIPTPTTKATISNPGPKTLVTLRTATLSYEILWLSDGRAVLVPQYTYRASNNTSEQVLALSPNYYHVQSTK